MATDHKEQTHHLPIAPGPEPDEVVLPLSQHIGMPCEAMVAVGALVNVGQKIAEANAFVSAPVHSSVSGKVTAILDRPHPLGNSVKAIVIENDRQYTLDASCTPYPALDNLDPESIVKIVKESGLVGLGGATFPTHVKLAPPKGKPVDILVINGAECEPYLTADHRVILEETELILYGIQAMAKALQIKTVLIAIETNKPDAIHHLQKSLGSRSFQGLTIRVVPLKTQYPQGAEKVLVKTVTKRKVPPLGIPLDVGVVVANVGTAAQLGKTLKTGIPLVDRVVTVAGQGVKQPGNYRVRMGTPFKLLLPEWAAPQNPSMLVKIVMGGPMMGIAQHTLDVPVIKGTSGVLVLAPQRDEEQPCIRCSRCVSACPIGLFPLWDADDSCMECGCCAYVCPAKRQLVQRIKLGKQARKPVLLRG